MPEPLVCCVMLTKDRPAMARRAVECFRSQTYERKRLLVVNSGPAPLLEEADDLCEWEPCFVGIDALSIGALRNHACKFASTHYARIDDQPEIFAHFDDDDLSHPNRLAEQVALLRASGADAVGYRDMLFWYERPGQFCGAWLYTNPLARGYALGTSLMYWRKIWERCPFDDVQKGEDDRFCRKVGVDRVQSESSIPELPADDVRPDYRAEVQKLTRYSPRMIASIHSSNTSSKITPGHQQWKRVPEWDGYCRERMKL